MKSFWYNSERKNVAGIRIRKLRNEQGLTQEQLAIKAQLLGYAITGNAIAKLEAGTRFIPDYEISIFAEILSTSPEELLKG